MTIKKLKSIDIINVLSDLVSEKLETTVKLPILFTVEGQEVSGVENTYYLPNIHPLLQSVLVAIPLQLIAYHTACIKGCDVDKPRNLAKSVTVE